MRKYLVLIFKILVGIGIVMLAINYFGGWIMARLGIAISPTWDAGIQILTMALGIFVILYSYKGKTEIVLKYFRDKVKGLISKINHRRYIKGTTDIKSRYVWLAIIGIPIIFMLGFSLTQYSFLVEQSMNKQIANKIKASTQNAYIYPTADPQYHKLARQYDYSLLIEFGVNNSETITDISITTENDIKLSNYFRGKPRQQDEIQPDSVTIHASQGKITVISGGGALPQVTAHEYRFKSLPLSVNTDFSLYIYLESDKPFSKLESQFADASLVIRHGQIQTPDNKE